MLGHVVLQLFPIVSTIRKSGYGFPKDHARTT
jgi:hypothetical protein